MRPGFGPAFSHTPATPSLGKFADYGIFKIVRNVKRELIPHGCVAGAGTKPAATRKSLSLVSRIFFCIGLFSVSIVAANFVNSSFCSLRKFARNHDVHRDIQIAASRSSAFGNAAAFDSEGRTGLRSGRNCRAFPLRFQESVRDFRAKRGLRKRNWNMAEKVVFAPFEKLVVLDIQNNIQISGRTALCGRHRLRRRCAAWIRCRRRQEF